MEEIRRAMAALTDLQRDVISMRFAGGLSVAETARAIGKKDNAVKALQHAMFDGRYQSSDLSEIDYARVAEAMGCRGIRVEDPGALAGALAQGLAERDRPTLLDVVVTRDPAQMLPGLGARNHEIKPGDRTG